MGGSTIKFNVTFCIEALFAVPYQTGQLNDMFATAVSMLLVIYFLFLFYFLDGAFAF